jgi:hypothetical protein
MCQVAIYLTFYLMLFLYLSFYFMKVTAVGDNFVMHINFIFQAPMVVERAPYSVFLVVCGRWYLVILSNLVLVLI